MSPTNNSLQICRLLLHIIFLHRHRTKLIYDNLLYIFVIRADQVLSTDNVWVWICRICHRLEYTHTTGEGKYFFPVHFFSSSLFPPCRFLGLSAITQENHLIIFIDNYQRQTPCKQIGQGGAELQQQCCLYGQTQKWAAAVQKLSHQTLHKHPVWPAC